VPSLPEESVFLSSILERKGPSLRSLCASKTDESAAKALAHTTKKEARRIAENLRDFMVDGIVKTKLTSIRVLS
jgi:hypothetical protein